ncbi:hypothetical protein Tco_1344567 [Tanacetum coccineum]
MKGVFNRMVATRYQEAQLIMVEMKEKKSGKGKRHEKGALNFAVVGVMDYEMLEERLMDFCQEILICGGISYLRD